METASIQLEFPALVSLAKIDERYHYRIMPLFFGYTSITHRRFEGAMSKFRAAVQKYLKGYQLDGDTLDELNWFSFNPKVDYKVYDLTIPIQGKQVQKGLFGIALFELQDIIFACLPYLNSFMFIVERDENGQINLTKQAPKIIGTVLKRIKERDPDEYEFSNYTSSSREFVTTLEFTTSIKNMDFGFEKKSMAAFFATITESNLSDGEEEIWNVGKNLNNDFPTKLNRAFYQEKMVTRLHHILFKKPYRNSPIAIVGEEGIGKKSIIHEVLYQYMDIDESQKRTIWHIDPTRIITGMSIVGMWQKRTEAILSFIKKPHSKHDSADILLIDNAVAMIHIGKSAQSSMTVNDILKPYLEKRELQLIVLATPEEWKVVQEKDRRFADLFQLIRLQEPDLETAVKMALENRKILEAENSCRFSIKAIQSIFDFRRSYLKNKALPGSVIKILHQLSVKYRGQRIDAPQVRAEFEMSSGMNQAVFDAPDIAKKGEISRQIGQKLIGQPRAVKTLANLVHSIKARLTTPNKPLGSFLFIGPTGVGKTQAAKVLSEFLTHGEENLMQFDMNEFIDHTAVQRLIGNAQNPEGQLTGKVRYQPFGIVLLDEIEKAHPKVLDLLLQILDDARLTDSLGRTIDFSNIIIIMTSNVGASQVSVQAGFKTSTHDDSAIYRKAVENKFRPEFVNRIDEVVIFKPLELEHILGIARLQIKELLSRDGFLRRTTILNIAPDALEWVARRGFNARMGGRALKRQIEKDLTILTANQLVSNYSKNPILFDIYLEKNSLVPRISKLEFTTALEDNWFPILPEPEKGRGFYLRLIRTLENIEWAIQQMENKDNDDDSFGIIDYSKNIHHYNFKEKIAETKERLTHLSLGFKDKKFQLEPSIPLRLKWSPLVGQNKTLKENYKDQFFQKEAMTELSEIYHRTNIQYNSIQTEFLNSYLEVAFLKIFSKSFIKKGVQNFTLRFESCVNDEGQKQIKYLCNLYDNLFEYLNIEKEVDKKKQYINIQGYSIDRLLKGELGIHLIHLPYQNPIPIRVILDTKKHRKKTLNNQVIRVYNENTLTDFRTNLTNAINITKEEFSLLVYAGTGGRRTADG